MNIISKGGKVYRQFSDANFVGYAPVPIPEVDPTCRYRGVKIPYSLWQQVLSWFGTHIDNETQGRLYRKGEVWEFVPFPQGYPTGMTTNEKPDHPDFAVLQAKYADWEWFGSVHTHAKAAAFQSGTDSNDEKGTAGIHITVGKLGDKQYDIHGRVNISVMGALADDGQTVLYPRTQMFVEPVWSDWFALPPEAASLPAALHDQVIKWYLVQPCKVAFPAEWDTRLIKPVYTPAYGGYGMAGHGYDSHRSWDRDFEKETKNWDNKKWDNDLQKWVDKEETRPLSPVAMSHDSGVEADETVYVDNAEEVNLALEFVESHGMTPFNFSDKLAEMSTPTWQDLIAAARTWGFESIGEVEDLINEYIIAKEVADEERREEKLNKMIEEQSINHGY